MKTLLFLLALFVMNNEITVFDFSKSKDANTGTWYQTNDDVMGGLSTSKMRLGSNGNGIFSGTVSTANNGGFAMTRLVTKIEIPETYTKLVVYLEGDGKKYQCRLKSKVNQRFWYVKTFQTSGEKEKIEFFLKDFYPSFRGYQLDMKNFHENVIREIAFLIGNKKNESFTLKINKIVLQ